MSKKELILHIIDTFKQYVAYLPDHVQRKCNTVRNELIASSTDQVELNSIMAVTSPGNLDSESDPNIYYVLDDIYSDLEEIVKGTNENKEELTSALDQLRGLLGKPERFFP